MYGPEDVAGHQLQKVRSFFSVALEHGPRAIEISRLDILSPRPEINAACIVPRPSKSLFVRIDLKEEIPVGRALLKHCSARILITAGITAVKAVGDELTFQAHITLNLLRMAAATVDRLLFA